MADKPKQKKMLDLTVEEEEPQPRKLEGMAVRSPLGAEPPSDYHRPGRQVVRPATKFFAETPPTTDGWRDQWGFIQKSPIPPAAMPTHRYLDKYGLSDKPKTRTQQGGPEKKGEGLYGSKIIEKDI